MRGILSANLNNVAGQTVKLVWLLIQHKFIISIVNVIMLEKFLIEYIKLNVISAPYDTKKLINQTKKSFTSRNKFTRK